MKFLVDPHPIIPNLNTAPLKALVKHLTEEREYAEKTLRMDIHASTLHQKDAQPFQVTHQCATNMCLVGRLPLLGFPGLPTESWWDYSLRVIGDIDKHVWAYLFHQYWNDDVDEALLRLNDVLNCRYSTLGVKLFPYEYGNNVLLYRQFNVMAYHTYIGNLLPKNNAGEVAEISLI